MSKRPAAVPMCFCVTALGGILFLAASPLPAAPSSGQQSANQGANDSGASAQECDRSVSGSPYIPVDSWIYPAMARLYSLGYVDTAYLGLRPWTRASVMNMLEDTEDLIEDDEADGDPGAAEARRIYDALNRELHFDTEGQCGPHEGATQIESVYTLARGITGTPLDDSYHLGSTIVNDYGRPFQNGFNNYTGVSGYATAGRFALYVRGEFQGAPSATGYSAALAQALSSVNGTLYYVPSSAPPYGNTTAVYSQPTIPQGPIATATQGRFLEAYLSFQYLNHVLSIGKQDQWLGPAQGASMAFSNNAQNFYAFEINRIEPLDIPLLSRLTGPFRYEFLIGALRGHTLMPNPAYELSPSSSVPNMTNPGDPWVHVEKVSFKPYKDLEFGFERTAIFGGEGHSPVTLHTFLKSFFSLSSPAASVKNGRDDSGARFGAFDFTWRLPYLQKWLTLYTDSEVHDDVSPTDAPRRAAYRPGIYLSHVPGISKVNIRVEAASTDPSHSTVNAREYGQFMYWEEIEKQGYTNQGQLFGDWIGREDKGGQAWITYHLSGDEWIQINLRNQKATKDFIPGSTTQTFTGKGCPLNTPCLIPGGTTLNDIGLQVVKRIGKDFEIKGNFTLEQWKAPIYLPGLQTVTTTNIQLTWFPEQKIRF